MAEGEEDACLEQQLEDQLVEQKESLAALADALNEDPHDIELLKVHEELVVAIKDSEDGLLELKRARLLQTAESILRTVTPTSSSQNRVPETIEARNDEEEYPESVETEPIEGFSVGSKCRFRHTNGRWYDGHVIGIESDSTAKVSFMKPTSENMLICKFFLQQRCRFGSNCRLSHGVNVPLSSLKQYIPTCWRKSLVGSCIFALSEGPFGIWKEAELEAWDDELKLAEVIFRDDGATAKVGCESLSLSEYAQQSEEEEESSYEDYELDGSEEDSDSISCGIGFLKSSISQQGIQMDTVVFAKWEQHTRGIASKMMANMGYREGMGLGASGQGIVEPVLVKVLPSKRSLDFINETQESGANRSRKQKSRSRGGKRKRDKKHAAAARALKKGENSQPDVFNFINNQLAMQSEVEPAKREKQEDRKSLVAYDEEVKELRVRAEKLEEMVNRNRKEKVVYEAASRKLNETRVALAEAEAAHASASKAVVSKEKEKRWLKF